MNSLRSMIRGWTLVAATLLLPTPPAFAVQQTRSFPVGDNPSRIAVDPVTGNVLISNAPASRFGNSDISVLDTAGNVRTVEMPPGGTGSITISPAFRTAIVTLYNCTCTALVNLDTLAVTTTASGQNVHSVVVIEATGHAYLLAGGLQTNGAKTGTVTEVDLLTGKSATYPVPGFWVGSMAASENGTKLYITGNDLGGFAQPLNAYVQVFDIAAKSLVGVPMSMGLESMQVLVPPGSSEIYVLGHSPYFESSVPSYDPRRNSMQPTLFVLDATSLAVQRSILLPYTTNLDLYGAKLEGQAGLDSTTGMVYVTDRFNQRFMAVDPATSSVSTVGVESYVDGLAVNAAAGNVDLLLTQPGVVAIYSPAGERLDTVPVATPIIDPQTATGDLELIADTAGNAYVAVGKDQSVVMLKGDSATDKVVNLTDVWSDPADPGWGVFIQQQGTVAFAALFFHDAAGAPRWVVMPQGMRQGDGSFSGSLYRTTGPATVAGPTTASLVGTMRFTANTLEAATLTYTLDDTAVTRSVSRLPISAVPRTCGWSTTSLKSAPSPSSNFTSLWWNPAQSGWGLALSQQGSTAFAVVFGYDAMNQSTWTVMSNGPQSSANAFAGTLYRAMTGDVQTVGDLSLSFTSTDAGMLSYRVDGVQQSTPIMREEFSTPSSRCSS